ncbi:hypothetical protein B5F17_01785 [Butyricicoccus pullicaecorum]|uniref:Uncharacterized protein n=1 Tax=Butyricicoccus pullicaecorum TaxID=501571 RepID=A0A1Y4LB61_9FIRM|nr:hypothetical protein [Butyricicoccus pullicaecorum]OUP53966.1 hypothetical protein B5F17_01785 [Butyricicoccus pullicaecorum]
MEMKKIGLQFFAEAAAEADGAGDDGMAVDGFLEGFLEDEDSFEEGMDSDTPITAEPEAGTDSPTAQQEDEITPQESQSEPQQVQQPPQAAQELVSVAVGNTSIGLPKSAVDALSNALGGNAAEVIRRGLEYDNKNTREMALLTRLAEVSGKDLSTFMQEAEQQMIQMQVEREMQNVRAELQEGTPDEAIRIIAQKRVEDANNRRAFEQFQQRQAQAQQAARARQQAVNDKVQPWRDYIQQFGITRMEDIPKEVLAFADQGMNPIAAHYRFQAEQAQAQMRQMQAATKKNEQNRQSAVGSMGSSGGDEADAFLSGLLSED